MSVLQRILGKRPDSSPAPAWPVCESCTMRLTPRLPDEIARFKAEHGIRPSVEPKQDPFPLKTVPFEGAVPEGVRLYEGTQCEHCGRVYCINCHDVGSKGPFCPGCGAAALMPVLRAEG